jgi:predicted PurR-regulated permease PerM
MNKDAILATIIGFVIGLFITAMLLVGPKLVNMLPKVNFKLPTISLGLNKPTPTSTPAQKEFSVTIDSPLPDSIESENETLVSGSTAALSTVVIEANTTEAISEVKTDGKYAGKVTLIEGKNDITVTSYNKDKKATQTVTVFYTPETL